MNATVSIFLTLLIFWQSTFSLCPPYSTAARSSESSASLGDLSVLAVQTLQADGFHRQDAKEDKVFQTGEWADRPKTRLESATPFRKAQAHPEEVFASLGDFSAFAVQEEFLTTMGAQRTWTNFLYPSPSSNCTEYTDKSGCSAREDPNPLPSVPIREIRGQNSSFYTKNGHRTQITELSGRTIQNTFDALHRLTSESITSSSSLPTSHSALGTLSYAYDLVGNRTSRTTTGTVSQIIPSQSQSFTVNDRLTTDTYDANGNTTVSSSPQGGTGILPVSSSDIYSFDNKLIRRTRGDDITIDLTYNPDGHRLTKLISQAGLTQRLHHYLTDANNPTGYAQVIEEKDPFAPASDQLKKVHLYGHDLIATESTSVGVSPTSSIFYSYDGLGSVRSITNATGDLEETYDYDAYGTLTGLAKRNQATGLLESLNTENFKLATSSYLFTGEQWDADLGMYFLRARYLNTNTGRFHSQDTYEGRSGEPLTLHKHLYAHGNPVMFVDPSGQFIPIWLMGTLVHQQIGIDFVNQNPTQRAWNMQLRTIIEYFTGEYPDGAEGRLQKGNIFLKLPDLIDFSSKEVYEIKPAHRAYEGAVQLVGYVGALNLFVGPGFTFGKSYTPPPVIHLPFGFKALTVPAKISGLVLYELVNPNLTKATAASVVAGTTVFAGYQAVSWAYEVGQASFLASRGFVF